MNELPDSALEIGADGSETDRSSWLVIFSDLVLQLFAFVIVAVVLEAGRVSVGAPQSAVAANPPASLEPVAALEIGWPIRPRTPQVSPTELAPEASSPSVPAEVAAVSEPEPIVAVAPPAPEVVAPARAGPDERLVALGRYFDQLVQARGVDGAADVTVRDGEIVMSLGETVGFAPGSDAIPTSGRELLQEVRAVALSMPDLAIAVSGHTDDRPIRTLRFPSNLHLSLARAARVAEGLGADAPELRARVFASGYGAERPLASNETESGRARNRRVEIRLLPKG